MRPRKKMQLKRLVLTVALVIGIMGVTTTLAIYATDSDVLTNVFSTVGHSSEIVENPDGLKKEVQIANTDTADAFIRARVVTSPDSVRTDVFDVAPVNGWKYDEEDGFWYYLKVVPGTAKGATPNTTDFLMTKVVADSLDDAVKATGFEVTVYEESTIAIGEGEVTLADMKAQFALLEA